MLSEKRCCSTKAVELVSLPAAWRVECCWVDEYLLGGRYGRYSGYTRRVRKKTGGEDAGGKDGGASGGERFGGTTVDGALRGRRNGGTGDAAAKERGREREGESRSGQQREGRTGVGRPLLHASEREVEVKGERGAVTFSLAAESVPCCKPPQMTRLHCSRYWLISCRPTALLQRFSRLDLLKTVGRCAESSSPCHHCRTHINHPHSTPTGCHS